MVAKNLTASGRIRAFATPAACRPDLDGRLLPLPAACSYDELPRAHRSTRTSAKSSNVYTPGFRGPRYDVVVRGVRAVDATGRVLVRCAARRRFAHAPLTGVDLREPLGRPRSGG